MQLCQLMAAIRHLPQFDPQTDSCAMFVKRIQLFMDNNTVAAGMQAAVLLSALDGKMYALLRSLLAPEVLRRSQSKNWWTCL